MKRNTVFTATLQAAKAHRWLSLGTALCALSSVAVSLLPPLVMGHLIDRLTVGLPFPFYLALVYFGSLVLEGVLTAAQETTLELFGQKMTHALRTEMSKKLTHLPAATLAAQEPGAVAARFNGDVDAVEALFTSGVISMAADCCRIVSIFAVVLRKNPGLALVLLVVLPLLAVFTRYVQKRMLSAQLENRKAVAAISAQVPEALHNIRTIHLLGLENYMERRYDKRIGQSYAAVDKNNFFDAVYSPVVLTINAMVVGVVMLLSASFPSAYYETDGQNPMSYFIRQGVFAIMGVAAMLFIGKINSYDGLFPGFTDLCVIFFCCLWQIFRCCIQDFHLKLFLGSICILCNQHQASFFFPCDDCIAVSQFFDCHQMVGAGITCCTGAISFSIW